MYEDGLGCSSPSGIGQVIGLHVIAGGHSMT